MNQLIPNQMGDSATHSVERVGFDVLRAIVSARQAGSATVRALSQAQSVAAPNGTPSAAQDASMALLSGRKDHGGAMMGGAFAPHFAGDHPFAKQGESHG